MTPTHAGAQAVQRAAWLCRDFIEMRGLAPELETRVCPLIHEKSLSQMTFTRSS